jgi:hypothetical protein
MRTLLIGGLLLLGAAGPSAAQSDDSGNSIREMCKVHVQPGGSKGSLEAGYSGFCLGLITATLYLGQELPESTKFCIPKGVTVGQGIRVLLKYIEANPELAHRRAEALAIAAFRKSWPCK